MNVIKLMLLCLFSFLLFLPADDAQARAKSYPLMCRGGGAMKGKFTTIHVSLHFVGAKQGAGVRLPQSGECAWLDRGFLPGEPQKLVFMLDKGKPLIVEFGPQGVTNVGSASSKLEYLVNNILKGQVFQVHAYRGQCPGNKCNVLTVTKVN